MPTCIYSNASPVLVPCWEVQTVSCKWWHMFYVKFMSWRKCLGRVLHVTSYKVVLLWLWGCLSGSHSLVHSITSEGKKIVPNKKRDIGMEVYYLYQPNTYVIASIFWWAAVINGNVIGVRLTQVVLLHSCPFLYLEQFLPSLVSILFKNDTELRTVFICCIRTVIGSLTM